MKRQTCAMLLDLSACIGCRACQVACKEWNGLPAEPTEPWGGFANPRRLSGDTWKHLRYIEHSYPSEKGWSEREDPAWLFHSDSCRHCRKAPCLEACPTGAIVRTAEGMIVIRQEACCGTRQCATACPFGAISINSRTRTAAKCSFCHDRLGEELEPACVKVCPTGCLQFGEREEIVRAAREREATVRRTKTDRARLYGEEELGGVNVLTLLLEKPKVYELPEQPRRPIDQLLPSAITTFVIAAVLLGTIYLWFLWK